MKLASIRIRNLRSFADVTVPFGSYTCLVGPNGAGKSTVLCALDIFFGETEGAPTNLSQLDREDFHRKNAQEPIEITLTFEDLQSEAQTDFADYYRQGQLVISAIAAFDESAGKAEVRQYGSRLAMAAFKEFFRAVGDNLKVSDLRDIYKKIRSDLPQLPVANTKDDMSGALRQYETAHPDLCELIPSEDQFYGVSRGANRLAKYIQWVHIPAVKDVTTEQSEARNTALGKLLARTVRTRANFDEEVRRLRTETQSQYQAFLVKHQHTLDSISSTLRTKLANWAHPEAALRLEWKQDPDRSVRVEEPFAHIIAGEGDFEGELTRFGHGFQRSYLLALLQELAGSDDTDAPRLLLGCEEPELYQHPPQARHLAEVLRHLSHGNAQVIVSTHSPIFVSGEGFEDVRMVRKDRDTKCSMISHMSYSEIAGAVAAATGERPRRPEGVLAKIHQTLQPALNEMFFTNRLVLVEGLEDVAYIVAYLHLLGRWDDYRRAGCHIVPVNGKSEMLQPLVIAKRLRIPTYVVFDADADSPDHSGSRTKHEKDNRALLSLLGRAGDDPMPATTLWGAGFVMWHSSIDAIVEEDIGQDEWVRAQAAADRQFGQAGTLQKNMLHISARLSFAWEAGRPSPNLQRLCDEVVNIANSV